LLETKAALSVLNTLQEKAYKHPGFHSHHEAYGIIMEEVDEYFDHVKEHTPNNEGCIEELSDIAAACIKAMVQLCEDVQ